MGKVSLQDIADRLGVSRCTVSLALNGKAKKHRVSEELTKKIIDTAREMNYQPNEVARSLRVGLTKTMGVVVADISNEFFGKLVYYIQKRANEYGWNVIISNSDEEPEKMLESIRIMVNQRVDGVIMVPTNDSFSVARHILSEKIPLVQVDRFLPDLDVSYVIMDNFKASAEVTEMLYSEGCRRIAMFKHANSALNGRYEGYAQVMRDHGIFDERLVKDIRYSEESKDLKAAAEELLAMTRKLDAVIFQSHELFLSGMRNFKNVSDIKIASFDHIDAYSLVDFPVIYVEQPVKRIADAAVDILLKSIKGSKEVTRKVYSGKIRRV